MPILCPYCHASFQVDESSAEQLCTCPECGQQVNQTFPLSFTLPPEEPPPADQVELPTIHAPKKKPHYEDPVIAGMIAFFLPGFGQFYLQSYGTGCLFQILLFFSVVIAIGTRDILAILVAIGIWILSVAMACTRALKTADPDWQDRWLMESLFSHPSTWVRFSLRNFLLFTLLLCLGLGWYSHERSKSQRMWGWVERGVCQESPIFHPDDLSVGDVIRSLLGLGRPRIEAANFEDNSLKRSDLKLLSRCNIFLSLTFADNQQLTDADLKMIASHNELSVLRISGDQLTTDGLSQLSSLKRLRHLEIAGSRITDRFLQSLRESSWLTSITLKETPISNSSLAELSNLSISNLRIENSQISDDNLKYLEALQLESLELNCPHLTAAGLVGLRNSPTLHSLTIQQAKMTAEGLQYLSRIPSLKSLTLDSNRFDERDLTEFEAFENLEALMILDPKMTEENWQHMRWPPKLMMFGCSGSSMTDTALNSSKPPATLLYLDLSNTAVTDAGLKSIAHIPMFHLYLDGTKITIPGLQELGHLRLRSLRLGGPALDENQMRSIHKLKLVKILELRGSSISDHALDQLNGCHFSAIVLISTKVTESYAAKWAVANPQTRLEIQKKAAPKKGSIPTAFFSAMGR